MAGVGLLLTGLLTGCQGGPQIMRGDGTNVPMAGTPTVNSPAFAQVAAGQNLPMGAAPIAANRPLMAGQPVVGSGGAVYPVNYGGQPQPTLVAGQPMQPMMVGQPMPQPQPQPQPMPAAPVAGQTQQIVGVVQTPNGPQYVYAEAPPPAMPTPVMPTTTTLPTTTPPVTIAAPGGVPSAPVTTNTVPNYTAPVGHPTFVAPPPTTIPLPNLHIPNPTLPSGANFAPSETSGARSPEPLPTTVTVKPSGVTLPNGLPTNQTLGNFPAVPVTSNPVVPAGGVRLPTPSKPIDDDIPDAPIFLPGPK